MVEDLKTKSWTFVYIGANHDVVMAARKMSITNTLSFEANEASVNLAFLKDKKARLKVAEATISYSKNNFNENYFIDEDIKKPS